MGNLRGRLAAITGWLFAGRFRVAGVVLAVFLTVGLLARVGLALFTGLAFQDWGVFSPARLPLWLGVGVLFDLAVAAYLMLPFALVAWLVPDTRTGRWVAAPLSLLLALAAFVAFIFVAASEFVFWNEFGSRFNFIAVDYLVYTNEVIGNIRESYSMPLLFGAIGAATLALAALVARPLLRATEATGSSWRRRSAQMAVFAVLPLLSFGAVDARHQRALLANYQTVGYLQDGVMVELRPKGRYRFVDPVSGSELAPAAEHPAMLDEAIAYYQTASSAFRSGAMRRMGSTPDGTAIR